MRKIIDAKEIKEKGIRYCQEQHKRGKKRLESSCRNCPLHICIDHYGHIRVATMDFEDFVRDYNLMISELARSKDGKI